ncbi:MAG: hypothetical protein JNK05_12020 [Myxococcales bacterium]|nr:hypothetical protein [Myxococcales bacterium]
MASPTPATPTTATAANPALVESTELSPEALTTVQAIGVVVAGAATIAQTLAQILSTINVSREIAIAVNNYTGNDLINPKYYIESGKLVNTALTIPAGKANFISGSRTSGAARGTVAVVSYELQNTNYRLAIYWSVPFGYAAHDNVLYLRMMDKDTDTDEKLYDKMNDKAVKASLGTFTNQDSGYVLQGVMGTGGQATLNISIKSA